MDVSALHGIAVERLRGLLAEKQFEPSAGLTMLFHVAGAMAETITPHRALLSSRLLLLAVAHAHQEGLQGDSAEMEAVDRRVITAVGELLSRDTELLEARSTDYFAARRRSRREPLELSESVWSVLQGLMDGKNARAEPSIITAGDFLLNFPPAKSQAFDLLGELRIDPAEFRQAVESALAGPGNDWVGTHRDEPARADELGRLAFAQVLADRIREAHEGRDTENPSAFIVHIHGPWGSGKSSILNFLEKDLKDDRFNWIVVKFNAWRDQRVQPPWWSLIAAIYAGARPALTDEFERARLEWQWMFWRLRADFLPIAAVILCLILTAVLIALGFANSANAPLTILTGAVTLAGAVYLGSRSLALGSQRAAQAYADLKNDPYEPITKLFNGLMLAIPRPVAVFIDDLDRCDGKYVVDLLEGIQTLMRGSTLTYVIAADRKWICSSFEQRYQGFTPPIGEPGRPLGYLFLDKIFQISAPIPQLSSDRQSSYWQTLLKDESDPRGTGPPPGGEAVPTDPATALQNAEAEVVKYTTHEELQAYVRRVESDGDQVKIDAARAAAARRITSPQAAQKTQHRLKRFALLMEPNPRAMKRLVNAYGMHQATLFLSGRATEPAPLARWTIVELRWPLLADLLAKRPLWADRIRDRLSDEDAENIPEDLRDLFGDEFVVQVVGEAGGDGLTSAAIKSILGTGHHER